MSKSRIKILYLITSFNKDGPGNVLLNLIEYLDKEAFEPFVVCLYLGSGELEKILKELSIKTFSLDMPRGKKGWFDFRAIFKIAQLIRSNRINLIHINLIRAIIFGGAAAIFTRTPFIVTIHNTEEYITKNGVAYKIIKSLDQEILRRANYIACVSNGVKNYVMKHYPRVDPSKFCTIYNGVSVKQYLAKNRKSILRNDFNISYEAILIGFVGRFTKQKGLLYLVEAVRNIVPYLRNTKFVLIGDGEQKEELIRKIHEYNLQNFFIFTGYCKNIIELFADFDIFILPSLWEGLPVALLEAMASGLPCVVTDVSGNSEAVLDGETGFVVPPGDTSALADAVIKLVQNKTLREMMGKRSKTRIFETFTAELMADKYKECYLKALKLHKTGSWND